MSNLAQRFLTSIVAAPLALALAWWGGWAFGVLVAAVAVAAQAEVYGLLRASGTRPLVLIGLPLGAVAALHVLVPGAEPILVLGGIVVMLSALLRQRERPLLDVAGTLFGVFYPPLLLGFALQLRAADGFLLDHYDGFWLTAAVLMSVWGADTFAYVAGRFFGRHPLFPRVSPKKTWEGAAGGFLGALVLLLVFREVALSMLDLVDVAILALCAGLAGPLGDLTASLFKRSAGVKDSGRWIPGHGGMLDRIDAAAIAIPLATLYLDHVAGLF